MRIVILAIGAILLGLGIALSLGAIHYSKSDEVARIGGLSATVTEQDSPPRWLGIAGIVIGGALLIGGALKKS